MTQTVHAMPSPQTNPEFRHGSGLSGRQELARFALQNEVTLDPALQLFARHLLDRDPLGGFYGGTSVQARRQLANFALAPDIAPAEGEYTTADINAEVAAMEAQPPAPAPESRGAFESLVSASTVGNQSDAVDGIRRPRAISLLRDNEDVRHAGLALPGEERPAGYFVQAGEAYAQQQAAKMAAVRDEILADPTLAAQVRPRGT